MGGSVGGGTVVMTGASARLPKLEFTRPYARIQDADTFEQAIKLLRRDDPRPLLLQWQGVIEEKDAEKATKQIDEAFSGKRTFLASPYFQCYELDPALLGEGHPLRDLFSKELATHVVAISNDGRVVQPVTKLKNKSIWKAMSRVFKHDYGKSVESSVKSLEKVVKKIDALKADSVALLDEVSIAREKNKARVVAKLEAEIEELDAERAELEKQKEKLYELAPKGAKAEAEKVAKN